MTKKIITVILLTLSLLLFLVACDFSSDPNGPTKTSGTGIDTDTNKKYAQLFADNHILNVDITIEKNFLDDMYTNPENFEYFSATIKVDDTTIRNAGIRIMGNTNLDGEENSQNRYSYRIRFDKFVSKQYLHGLDKLVLSNISKDPSYMREVFMSYAFQKLNTKAPLATYAKVTINGEYAGFYVALEAIDDGFQTRNFGNDKNNLYKAEKGATLEDLNSLTLLEQKNGKDTTKSDLETLIETLQAMPLEEKGDIEKVLDVDSVLKYVAVNSVFGNFSSYLGASSDNYYLLRDNSTSKFYIIPWDFNVAFGGQNKDNGVSVTTSVDSPVYRTIITERPLIFKILTVEEYYDKYLEYVNECIGLLEVFEAKILQLDSIISEEVKNDPSAFFSFEQYQANIGKSDDTSSGIISITEYAKLRLETLKK